MDIHTIKEYIIDNDKIEPILEDLGMHHIVHHENHYSMGFHDGDNPSSTILYPNSNLTALAFTRKINENANAPSDIFTLVQFIKQMSFPQALNYICEIIGLDYYENENDNIPMSLQFLNEIEDMTNDKVEDDKFKTKIRDISLLNYYSPYVNDMFKNDGIDYKTQIEFNIGYDDSTNRITIPIFNELSQLIGVKGRLFIPCQSSIGAVYEVLDKYIYLERCNKSHILYGLNKTYNDIISLGIVYVGEGEKFVMQLWSGGIYNSVALGGHKISKHQLLLLQRLGVKIVLCFDKDIEFQNDQGHDDIETECLKFEDWDEVYYMLDCDNLLLEKDSPSDNMEKFNILKDKYVFKYTR